ncbi:hypothetical protein RHGRI_033249 [Rhododendron griersonianum]|uniref:K-box domain-containing protein n=1 Tax=Rhododendron griersonianum TaxID=479676 RepID=A0AAV6I1P7_9ERIC|nr:hypothetical protein RHGRI_033249 [Rhododendron griersonianum]
MTALAKILYHYRRQTEPEEMVTTDGCEAEVIAVVFLDLEEPYVDQVSENDLIQLENQIDDALRQIRSRKTQLIRQSITALREKERLLKEENEALAKKIAATATDGNTAYESVRGSSDLYHNYMNDRSQRPVLQFL